MILLVVVGLGPLEGRQIGPSTGSTDSQQTKALGQCKVGHFGIGCSSASMAQSWYIVSTIGWVQIMPVNRKIVSVTHLNP